MIFFNLWALRAKAFGLIFRSPNLYRFPAPFPWAKQTFLNTLCTVFLSPYRSLLPVSNPLSPAITEFQGAAPRGVGGVLLHFCGPPGPSFHAAKSAFSVLGLAPREVPRKGSLGFVQEPPKGVGKEGVGNSSTALVSVQDWQPLLNP